MSNQIETLLRQEPSWVFATIIESNPAAVSDKLNTLGLYNGTATVDEMKSIIDSLYNTKQYAKLRSALNVNYVEGVLPLEFDQAFKNVRSSTPVKKSGNGEVVANYTPLVDSVLDFVCQMLGNCAPQQPQGGSGQPVPQPFNWMPVLIGIGILAATGVLITLLVVFGRKS
jgi:hypothetical protein